VRAYLCLRPGVHYRREAFAAGLEACGYTVVQAVPLRPRLGDVLVIWNRYRDNARAADRFEAAGLPVLVAENGYLGNDFAGSRWYAIARNQHNGAGTWEVGGPERWDSLGVPLQPWRPPDGETIILPQRGIGPPGVAMPADWPSRTLDKLKAHGIRARIRPHPGQGPALPLEVDLSNASRVVTWGSGAAIKALAWGCETFADFSEWIARPAALPVSALIEGHSKRDDAARLAVFRRLAWAQWRLDEIASGAAFEWLLNRNERGNFVALNRRPGPR
jgi:hypothetical protein